MSYRGDQPNAQKQVVVDAVPRLKFRSAEKFEAFYQREFSGVVGLAYALSGSRWAAEELAQEAFLAAHRKWNDVGGYDQPGAWVRRVVSNLATSLVRRRLAEARALVKLAARRPEGLPPLEANDEEFWRAVRSLPKRQAQVIALHYLQDLSVAEIAETLDIAEGTVKAHLHRGRLELARQLGLEEGADR
jgi:RNA polymerase sigma-70 factor (sigma-E family)